MLIMTAAFMRYTGNAGLAAKHVCPFGLYSQERFIDSSISVLHAQKMGRLLSEERFGAPSTVCQVDFQSPNTSHGCFFYRLTGDWFITSPAANQTNLALKGLIALRVRDLGLVSDER